MNKEIVPAKTASDYQKDANAKNTEAAYRQAIHHFTAWGGLLPCSPMRLADYLAEHATILSIGTLRVRTSAIGRWHRDQGFQDPTQTTDVKKVLTGIAKNHPQTPKRARPMGMDELEQLINHLDTLINTAMETPPNEKNLLRAVRDKAMILMGFWGALRSSELISLRVELTTMLPNRDGLETTLTHSKTDQRATGRTLTLPALQRLCPFSATEDWLHNSGLKHGPLFQGVHNKRLSGQPLHRNSVIRTLKSRAEAAGLTDSTLFSGHSLRRGFATWAGANDWHLSDIMQHVGWKKPETAMQYIDAHRSAKKIGRSLNYL